MELNMANVLIIDLLEESAYLLRSLLRGRGHSVSIAVSEEEGRAKLETGLFDTVVVDLCDPSEKSIGISQYANDLLPGMPLVALARHDSESGINGPEIFAKIYRPVKGTDVNRVCERAVAHALSLGVRRKSARVAVDVPLTIEFAGEKYATRMTDVSDRGFAIDADVEAFSLTNLEKMSSLMATERLTATIRPSKELSVRAQGRIAFIDRGRRSGGRMIGVVFESLDDAGRQYVDSLVHGAPEAAAPVLAAAA
jgi:CheY-like chemotaxis protein